MQKPTKKNHNLRLSEAQGSQLEALASRYDVSETKIVEWALKALNDYAEAHGGRVILPINFGERRRLWTMDNRRW